MYCLDTTELVAANVLVIGLYMVGCGAVVVGTITGARHVYNVVINGWYAAAKRERERTGQ